MGVNLQKLKEIAKPRNEVAYKQFLKKYSKRHSMLSKIKK